MKSFPLKVANILCVNVQFICFDVCRNVSGEKVENKSDIMKVMRASYIFFKAAGNMTIKKCKSAGFP